MGETLTLQSSYKQSLPSVSACKCLQTPTPRLSAGAPVKPLNAHVFVLAKMWWPIGGAVRTVVQFIDVFKEVVLARWSDSPPGREKTFLGW